jgi:pantetheine-phosphate adenylyltransferase
MKARRALYAGSFDPFTNGHLSIVEKSAELFDEVIVGIAENSNKKRSTDIYEMQDAIREQLKYLDNVTVVIIERLVADYCNKKDICYLVRGLRNTSDYLYEENIAKINKEINPSLRTIYFRADNDVISSSMIRELREYGKDVSRFVPEEIHKILY